MRELQLIYPYYDNPGMLEVQLKNWTDMPWQFKHRFRVILVDDGSPNTPAAEVIKGETSFELELYRIGVNIPWNQNGAHNLGMHVAQDGWCLSTDIDHVVVPSQMNRLLDLEVEDSCYYTFARRQVRDVNTVGFKRHPNSWLLTRAMFWESGGYDEDFSGYYGSDCTFRAALTQVGKRIDLEDIFLVVYDEQDLPDANTREFGRKDSEYYSVKHPHLRAKRKKTTKAVNPLRFPWERVL